MKSKSNNEANAKNILVLGAYGLIGQGIVRRLITEGHNVLGLGRSETTARRVIPQISWTIDDIRNLTSAQDWETVLKDISIVVNCSGALQDGPDDDLEVIHHYAIAALASHCAKNNRTLIQISAVGSTPDASTHFLASKARGDEAIRASGVDHYIFRPGLVLSANAYGGTALLRMLAAIPFIQPLAQPDAQIQVISIDDIAMMVSAAVSGDIEANFECDLVSTETYFLKDIVTEIRNWLGFREARWNFTMPKLAVKATNKFADGLAHLGWRSPLRSTSLTVLSEGIRGEYQDPTKFNLPAPKSLRATLASFPVGNQDRVQARMSLLAPAIILCLSFFWVVSGLIGFVSLNEASQVLERAGWSAHFASASVIGWSLVDIAIGLALAIRKYAARACLAAIATSFFYLGASTVFVPSLWLDPLGPLIKILPAIMLALVARVALENRW